MMNIVIWNCKGASSKGFASLMKDISAEYEASFVVLLETHVSSEKAKKIISRFPFHGSCKGFSSGIGCIQQQQIWQVDILRVHRHFIHLKMTVNNETPW